MYHNTNKTRTLDVLMVDSEQKLSLVTKTYFSHRNINIITTNSISQAWDNLFKWCPDLIIIDIIICNVTGNEFVQELQQDRKFKHIPIIFLTAKGLTEDRIKGYKSGCNVYVSKPFDPDELESIVINLVKKKALSTEWIIHAYTTLREINISMKLRSFPKIHPKLTLTSTERLILAHILNGKQNHEIAQIFQTSKRHIENYVTRLLDKTFTKNSEELRKLPWNNIEYGE